MTGKGIDISALDERRPDLYEAALWTLRLHDRTQGGGRAFDTLLRRKASSDDAYTKVRCIWQDLAELDACLDDVFENAPAAGAQREGILSRLHVPSRLSSAIAAMLALFIGTYLLFASGPLVYATEIGEQRVVMLSDGTRVMLNTATRVSVDFSDHLRRFRIDRGEALFEVAHDRNRPFVVDAADSHVRALGTSFVVRRDGDRVDVTLLSGKVEITRDGNAAETVSLLPGDRLRLHEDFSTIALDRPQISVVTAWKNGQLILRETPVSQALHEINRYNRKKVHVAGGISGDARVSGVFRVTDAKAFAESLAGIYHLKVDESPRELLLRPQKMLR